MRKMLCNLTPVIAAIAALLVSQPASAASIKFTAVMLGTNEVPVNASPATGFSTIDITGDTMTVDMTWSGLIGGNPSAAHIHCCIPFGNNVGVAVGFPSFPSTTSGTYFHVFNLLDPSIYTAAFLNGFGGGTAAGAEAALINGMVNDMAYTNIHNAVFPGGEIRGNIADVVPEPASLTLLATGLGAAMLRRRHRKG